MYFFFPGLLIILNIHGLEGARSKRQGRYALFTIWSCPFLPK